MNEPPDSSGPLPLASHQKSGWVVIETASMLIGGVRAGLRFVRHFAMNIGPEFLHHDRDCVQSQLRLPGADCVGESSIGGNELVRVSGGAEECAPGMIAVG